MITPLGCTTKYSYSLAGSSVTLVCPPESSPRIRLDSLLQGVKMKKSRFSEDQIVGILGEVSAGKSVREVCRALVVTEATFYTWKRKAERDLEIDAMRALCQATDRVYEHRAGARVACISPNSKEPSPRLLNEGS
jgi:hypothetical protein